MKPTLKDQILESVDEIAIYERYMGQRIKLGRAIRCPFPGKKDKHPSFSLYKSKSGKILWKYFSGDERGDVFAFVQNMLDIGFKECLDQIAQDFIINKNQSPMAPIIKYKEVEEYLRKKANEDSPKKLYTVGVDSFVSRNGFASFDINKLMKNMDYVDQIVVKAYLKFVSYWESYGIDIDEATSQYDFYPLLHSAFNHDMPKDIIHDVLHVTDDTVRVDWTDLIDWTNVSARIKERPIINEVIEFVVNGKEKSLSIGFKYANDRMKIYNPFETKERKHFSNTKATDIFTPARYSPDDDYTYGLCSGPKDSICLYGATGIYGISLNSESCIPDHSMAIDMKKQFPGLVTVYDADNVGVSSSEKLYDLHGIPYVNMINFIDDNINNHPVLELGYPYIAAVMGILKHAYIDNGKSSTTLFNPIFPSSRVEIEVIKEIENRRQVIDSVFKNPPKDIADIARFSSMINLASVANVVITKMIGCRSNQIHYFPYSEIIKNPIEQLRIKIHEAKEKGTPV